MPKPMRILAVDVGTGTQDILLFESGKTIENCFKMVMPSPTVIVAERIKQATAHGQPILLTGVTMGGGPSHWAARDHALAGYPVAVTPRLRERLTMTSQWLSRWVSRSLTNVRRKSA